MLNEKLIVKIKQELREKCFLDATTEFINSLLSEDQGLELAKRIVKIQGLDTDERDWLIDLVSLKLTGMEAPLFSSSEEYSKTFFDKMVESLKKTDGIDFIDEMKDLTSK